MRWQEHAHLFANGKFNIKIDDGKIFSTDQFAFLDYVVQNIGLNGCTLIARPISDMTDAEREEVNSIRDTTTYHWEFQQKKFMYYLTIGVLPKIFEHCFDDGTVIDATKLEGAL